MPLEYVTTPPQLQDSQTGCGSTSQPQPPRKAVSVKPTLLPRKQQLPHGLGEGEAAEKPAVAMPPALGVGIGVFLPPMALEFGLGCAALPVLAMRMLRLGRRDLAGVPEVGLAGCA